MKRLILTSAGTVAGVAALLSFKTQTHPVAGTATLPSAAASPASTSATSDAASTPPGRVVTGTPTTSGTTSRRTSSSPPTSAPASSSASASAAKTYTGQAVTTRYGVIQVKATIANGKITNVAFVQLTAFDGRSQQINSEAAPQLLQETIQQQTAQVDTISGASYTSDGYRESLQSALDQAGLK